jgi:DNA-binding NarL/FixJ family response regulator
LTIRIIICDDQEIVCEGLEKILQADSGIQVVGIARDGQEAAEKVAELLPDLVLMDLKMPRMNGILATRVIHEKYPNIKVLVLTTYADDEWLFDAIRSGASGYLMKDTPRADLIEAVKGTAAGNSFIDPTVAGRVLSAAAHSPEARTISNQSVLFSEREMEILKLMVKGLPNADIARQLFLSEGTVRNYTSAIFSKLNVADRTQAVVTALRLGLLDLNEL